MSEMIYNISYTFKHKMAFLKVEKQLLGRNTLSGYLHDMDKIFLYLIFNRKKTHRIHRSYSKHHELNANTEKHYIQMAIDWECARFTKPDKPLNAKETLYVHFSYLEDKMYPILVKLNLV